jgi:hypothetical protein
LLEQDVFQVNHRHVVFTIDEELREIFLLHREKLLKDFMDEAARLVKAYFEKKLKVTPGIIAGIHTFGARINFNPHVHMLVTMGGMKKNGEWKTYDFIPFEMLRKQWQTVVLKLIRRKLNKEELKRVQPRLQRAYSENGEGFYVYAPQQKGNVKQQLGYIGRYMKRPAIAVGRIEAYDGETVTFRYRDKRDGEEKTETVSVEQFIGDLIRHIPDENFKTIRHYGVYSRRIKRLCKKLVGEWQKLTRKWITKAQRMLKRRTWAKRIEEQTGKPPCCPKCENYYEYKGEVCLEEGKLKVKYAVCATSKACLERMIRDVTGIQETKASEKKESPKAGPKQAPTVQRGRQICMPDLLAERGHTA